MSVQDCQQGEIEEYLKIEPDQAIPVEITSQLLVQFEQAAALAELRFLSYVKHEMNEHKKQVRCNYPLDEANILQESFGLNACLFKIWTVGFIVGEVIQLFLGPVHRYQVKSGNRNEKLCDSHSVAGELDTRKEWLIHHDLLTVKHAPDFA